MSIAKLAELFPEQCGPEQIRDLCAELSQLRQLCREMYKLWNWHECINTNCDNNGTITALGANGDPYPVHCEYCYRRNAAIEKYTKVMGL